MKYVTGTYALNINCSLETCGDWHRSALKWDKMTIKESNGSIYGDYGIEQNKKVPYHDGLYNVANHIRALLDLLIDQKFGSAQGMNDDFIVVDVYDEEIFEKVCILKNLDHWPDIDCFMMYEYREKWLDYKTNHGIFPILPNIEKMKDRNILTWRKEDDIGDGFYTELKEKYK